MKGQSVAIPLYHLQSANTCKKKKKDTDAEIDSVNWFSFWSQVPQFDHRYSSKAKN